MNKVFIKRKQTLPNIKKLSKNPRNQITHITSQSYKKERKKSRSRSRSTSINKSRKNGHKMKARMM